MDLAERHMPVCWQPRVRVASIELLLLMTVFAASAMAFLYLVGIDALNDKHPFQFFSDSNTYHRAYAGEMESFEGDLVSINGNYLGPLMVLALVGGNPYLAMLFNVAIFYCSLLWITAQLKLNPVRVGALLMLSPMTISTLLSVNKEIFLFPFIAFALHGYMRRSATAVLIALALSILARWQLTAFYLIMLLLTATPVRVFRSRVTVLVWALAGASVMYLLLQQWIEPVIAAVEANLETYDGGGSGLFERFLELQKQGLYFLIFPFKAAHLLFASAIRLRQIDAENIYNNLFVAAHCLAALLIFGCLVLKRRLTLKSDLLFASVMFLAVFCLSPIYAPRYLYTVYAMWVLVLAGAPQVLRRRRRQLVEQQIIPAEADMPRQRTLT